MADSTRKVALVTGGAKRVGRAIVEKLATSGFDIALTYSTSEKEAAETVSAVDVMGRGALAIHADLAQPFAAAEHIRREFDKRYDRLDALVNNASLYLPSAFNEIQHDPDLPSRLMAVNFESPMRLCQKFEPLLRAARGHIVNMVDLLAERPWPAYLAYCASKAALANLTVALAKLLAAEVTVNGIAPGVVDWPPDYPPEQRETYLKRVPLGRAGTPQDVANLVHLLVGGGGDYITGQIIRLDGGRPVT